MKPRTARPAGVTPAVRDEFKARNAAHDTEHWILLTPEELAALGSGHVPRSVRLQCLDAAAKRPTK